MTKDAKGCQRNAGAFWFSGGRHNNLGAPPGARDNAFVHNTLYANGAPSSFWGGIQHGYPGYPRIGQNRFMNNLVQNSLGEYPVHAKFASALLDGNIYHSTQSMQVLWGQGDDEKTYDLSTPEGLSKYRLETGQDRNSQVAQVACRDAKQGDFRLPENSIAIDRALPLTTTVRSGHGKRVPVRDTSCFSAGFKTGKGLTLAMGDNIAVAGVPAKVVAVDRTTSQLVLDRSLQWQEAAPVTYAHRGDAPDVGAFETH